MRRLIGPALLLLAGLAWVFAFAVPVGRADEARFVPWKDVKTPPLALRDLAGRQHALADYRGKVVLVSFWATWCEPCREEMPSMQRLKERFAGQPFAVLAVNYDEADTRAGEFLKRSSFDLTVLLDPSQDASRAWRVRVLPASFLVGPDGRARYAIIGDRLDEPGRRRDGSTALAVNSPKENCGPERKGRPVLPDGA